MSAPTPDNLQQLFKHLSTWPDPDGPTLVNVLRRVETFVRVASSWIGPAVQELLVQIVRDLSEIHAREQVERDRVKGRPDVHEADHFTHGFRSVALAVHQMAREKGWWEGDPEVVQLRDELTRWERGETLGPLTTIGADLLARVSACLARLDTRNTGELLALIHSEVSEALEGVRHGNPASDHIPAYTAVEEELADVVIRIMDLGVERGYRVPEAILAKIAFNATREHKHGGKVF